MDITSDNRMDVLRWYMLSPQHGPDMHGASCTVRYGREHFNDAKRMRAMLASEMD